jgi:hypothetical protein
MEPADHPRETLVPDTTRRTQPPGQPDTSAKADIPIQLRLLNGNEVVSRGDFVAGEHQEFELWEGPAGFRADSFVKPIYRRARGTAIASKR